jgi:hypothetical protein
MEKLNEGVRNDISTKVVDENGKPLLMYHGGSFTGGEFKGNGWFTSSKRDAKYYAKQFDGSVTSAYLIINNPLYSGHIGHLNIEFTDDIKESVKKRHLQNTVKVKDGIVEFIETNSATLIASDIGKDGVIELYDGRIIDAVVFNNEQIIIKKIN